MLKKITQTAFVGMLGASSVFGVASLASAEEMGSLESDAKVEFEENTDTTNPVDPTDPTKPVEPEEGEGNENGTPGPLSIDYASHFDFGKIKKTGNAATYIANPVTVTPEGEEAKQVAPYVQVTDNRGTNAGWTLSVSQREQLTNVDTNAELEGAEITLDEGIITGTADTEGLSSNQMTLVPNGEKATVVGATDGTKGGTVVNAFGTAEDVGVSLDIVAGTKIDDGEYKATIDWTLEDTPAE